MEEYGRCSYLAIALPTTFCRAFRSGDLPGDAMLRLHSGKLLNLGTLRGSVTGYRKFSLAHETIIVLHSCERFNLSLDQTTSNHKFIRAENLLTDR